MSILAAPTRSSTGFVPKSPRRKRWTVAQFHRLWELGLFDGLKAMLLDGEIIEMAVPGPPHDQGVGLADYQLKAVFQIGYWVRVQQPLLLSLWTDPVPDLAVVIGSPRDYRVLPTTALLILEVSDSSLDFDTRDKPVLYATAMIEDYWVVDLNGRQLIVFRDPQPDLANPGRNRYQQELRIDAMGSIAPLAAPQTIVKVADLLP